jgi:hypothetical protein
MSRIPLPSNIVCYHCGSSQITKKGFDRNKQRYRCRACGRISRANPQMPDGKSVRMSPSESHALQDRLILELLAIEQRIGRTPATKDIDELYKAGEAHPRWDYYKVFGNLDEALKKAGLKSRYQQTHDKEKLLEELRVYRAELKRPVLAKDVKAARIMGILSPIRRFRKVFGSIGNAINAAGAGRKKYSRDEIIEIIRKMDAKLGRHVLLSDIDDLYRAGEGPAISDIQEEFGGLMKARGVARVRNVYHKAGHATRNWQKYSLDILIEQLKSLGKELGRRPTVDDITRASKNGLCAGTTTFIRMFGSLNKAYEAAGINKTRHKYTLDILIEQLKSLGKELGRRPTAQDIAQASKNGRCAGRGTFVIFFGSLNNSYAAAGFKNLRQQSHPTNKSSRQ